MIIKKRVLFVLLIITFLIIIFFIGNVRSKTFERMDDIVQFMPAKDGTENLYGLTDTGKIYCYNYKSKKADVLVDKSDIIFYKNGEQSLIIHNDGSIYIDKTGDLEGELLDKIEGAIAGDTFISHTAVITDNGRLYMYGHNEWGNEEYNMLGTGDVHKLNQLTLVDISEKVIMVDCGLELTVLLTENGKLYTAGRIGMYYSSFTEYVSDSLFIDLQGNNDTVLALQKDGGITVLNNDSSHIFDGMMYAELYNKDFTSLSMSSQNVIGINKDGEFLYWGVDLYKPDDFHNTVHPTTLEGISSANEVYCTWDYAYVIKKDKIICVPLERQNRIVRFLNKYNIFAPHYK